MFLLCLATFSFLCTGAPRWSRITQLDDKHIVKFAPSEYLRGELHFYRSIPSALSHYFPRLVEGRDDASLEIPYITITKARTRKIYRVLEHVVAEWLDILACRAVLMIIIGKNCEKD